MSYHNQGSCVDQLANIESQIKTLWEKAQQAGDLIIKLREEKTALQSQATQLQQEIAKLRAEISSRDAHVQRLTAANDAKSTAILANGEREALAARAKELLAKIEAYL